MPEAPGAVRWIARTLEEAGHETWVVGGAVRDSLLGVPHEDWDLATAARPGQVRRLFKRTVPIGIDHGTVGVLSRDGTLYEVTTFRRDVETFGRRAVVEFADRIEDDLARRDFTLNAVAWHPLRNEIKDPYGGTDDLARSTLRTVGEARDRFAEDYLRVLRGLRFAGRYRLDVDPDTWAALCPATANLGRLSAERIRDELLKVLTLDPRPSGALSLYAASGALARAFPELAGKVEADTGSPGSADRWARDLLTADVLSRSRPLLRLAVLLRGTGAEQTAALLIRLRFSNAEVRTVTGIVAALDAAPPPDDDEGRRRWLSGIGPHVLGDWIRVTGAEARVRQAGGGVSRIRETARLCRQLRSVVRSGAPLRVEDLALGGRDLIRLGLRPGPAFGEILEALLDRVLSRPELNALERLEPIALDLAGALEPSGTERPE